VGSRAGNASERLGSARAETTIAQRSARRAQRRRTYLDLSLAATVASLLASRRRVAGRGEGRSQGAKRRVAPANFDSAYSDGESKARSTVDGWEPSSRDEAAGSRALRRNHQGGRTEMDHPSHEPIIPSELERIARIGSWSSTPAGLMRWSDEMYRVFDVSPETFVPDVDSLRKLTHPDRRRLHRWIAERAS
jgi:hypothetical protein